MNNGIVLLVEPNDDNRHLMTLQLRKENYIVFAFNEAKIAIHTLQCQRIHSLIVSKEMPGMPVERLIKAAKACDVWVIATTTSPLKEETTRALRSAGADIILWKPYKFEALRRALMGLPPYDDDLIPRRSSARRYGFSCLARGRNFPSLFFTCLLMAKAEL